MTNERVIELIGRTSGKFLDLSNYRLTQLPPEIAELKTLTKLSLFGNKLTQLPPYIGELENLEELDLSYNLLIQLPPEIGELKNLKILNLTRNQLTKLPPEIGELKNLNYFYLSGNQITQLPPEIGKLKNLRTFYLSGNQLTQLPTEIGELKNLRALNLSDNPLTSPPPEIVSMGVVQIVIYLKQLNESTENNEAKLILVGNGGVGKTCLANWLIKNKFVEDKITEGINISEWVTSSPSRNSKIKLNIWDFGGQEIYHATHQFFLTTRSVYLLVWNARKTKDYDTIYYWLHTIEAFGEDSPIILVMSKMNESDDDLNLEYIKSKFNIADYLKIDSIDGTGIHRLKERISKTAWHLPLMRSRFPNSYYRVREKLENLGRNWITEDEFYKICISEGLDDANISLLDWYLHQLGVILHFNDRIGLKNIVILKPKWATEAFYNILSTKSVRNREGVLLHSELEHIWDKETYPSVIFPQLMELMNKFELAYELSDKSKYLVPELLPSYSFDFTWDEKDNLRFYYCYDYFLPPGIITRFIVRMHQDIDKKENGLPLCWREGAVLKLQNSLAYVKMNPHEKQIEIRIKGDNKREGLAVICHCLDQINSGIKKLNIIKKVPCNCSENCPQRYFYEELLEAEKANIKNIQCHKSYMNISISLLLDGYKRREERGKEEDEFSGRGPVFVISPTVQAYSQANPNIQVEQKTNVRTSINLNLEVELPQIQTEFDNLRDELENLNPKLDSDLDKIQDSLDELSPNSDKEKLVKPLNKLNRFLTKLSDPDSNYNKAIRGTEKGIQYAQKLGRTYNKFAQWLAMPQVPDLLL